MAFSYYRQLTVDHTKVPNTDQTNFPVLFRSPKGTVNTVTTAVSWVSGDKFPSWLASNPIMINGTIYTVSSVTTDSALVLTGSAGTQNGVAYNGTPYLATTGNGGKVQNANGYDIYVYSDSSLSTRIPLEREFYDATTGEYVGWFKKTLTTASDTSTIYIAYGDSGVSTDPNSDGTYGTTSVWDTNYKGVWHLPDGTTLTANDSTSNGSGGTLVNTPTATTGQIDGGANFVAASTQKIDIANNSDFNTVATGDWTIEAWVKPVTGWGGYFPIFQMGTNANYIGDEANVGWSLVKGDSLKVRAASAPTNGVMVHLVGTVSGTTYTLYINASADTTSSSDSGYGVSGTSIAGIGYASSYFNGMLDEVRVSNIARSADWITTEYNNQNLPLIFYTVGNETTPGGGIVNIPYTNPNLKALLQIGVGI